MSHALAQVRTLALRSTSSNQVLLAALETLYDVATNTSHDEADTYKMALKACRDQEELGPLHGLVTKLLGTEMAKKTQTAVDSWKKAMNKKTAKKEDMQTQSPAPASWSNQYVGSFGGGRGRGRGFRNPNRPTAPRACFICRSVEHLLQNCPYNVFNNKEKQDK